MRAIDTLPNRRHRTHPFTNYTLVRTSDYRALLKVARSAELYTKRTTYNHHAARNALYEAVAKLNQPRGKRT